MELKNKEDDFIDVIKDTLKSENKEKRNSDAKSVDLPRKKEISITNILCQAIRENFELFEMDGVGKGGKETGQEEREKAKERLCVWINGCCSLLCLMCCHSGTDSAQQITGKITLVFNKECPIFPLQICPAAHYYRFNIVKMQYYVSKYLQVKV